MLFLYITCTCWQHFLVWGTWRGVLGLTWSPNFLDGNPIKCLWDVPDALVRSMESVPHLHLQRSISQQVEAVFVAECHFHNVSVMVLMADPCMSIARFLSSSSGLYPLFCADAFEMYFPLIAWPHSCVSWLPRQSRGRGRKIRRFFVCGAAFLQGEFSTLQPEPGTELRVSLWL